MKRPDAIDFVDFALSERGEKSWGWLEGAAGVGGEGEGGSWVPYPEAKILPSLASSTSPRPSTHTRELKIPFTPTGARSWLEKARDKKRFSTEQNHHNGRTLICDTPLPTPLHSYQCQLNFVTTQLSSRMGQPFYSEWSGPQQFSPDSALKCPARRLPPPSPFCFLLSPDFKRPAGWCGPAETEREKFQHPASQLWPSSPPARPSNRGMQRWHVDNQLWGPATSKAWRAPKNTNVRPNGTLH